MQVVMEVFNMAMRLMALVGDATLLASMGLAASCGDAVAPILTTEDLIAFPHSIS